MVPRGQARLGSPEAAANGGPYCSWLAGRHLPKGSPRSALQLQPEDTGSGRGSSGSRLSSLGPGGRPSPGVVPLSCFYLKASLGVLLTPVSPVSSCRGPGVCEGVPPKGRFVLPSAPDLESLNLQMLRQLQPGSCHEFPSLDAPCALLTTHLPRMASRLMFGTAAAAALILSTGRGR